MLKLCKLYKLSRPQRLALKVTITCTIPGNTGGTWMWERRMWEEDRHLWWKAESSHPVRMPDVQRRVQLWSFRSYVYALKIPLNDLFWVLWLCLASLSTNVLSWLWYSIAIIRKIFPTLMLRIKCALVSNTIKCVSYQND